MPSQPKRRTDERTDLAADAPPTADADQQLGPPACSCWDQLTPAEREALHTEFLADWRAEQE